MSEFIYLAIVLQAYSLMYIFAVMSLLNTIGKVPVPWAPWQVTLVCLSAFNRWRQGFRTISKSTDPWTLFRLSPDSATKEQVVASVSRWVDMMQSRPLTYPPHQLAALAHVASIAIAHVEMREHIEKTMNAFFRAQENARRSRTYSRSGSQGGRASVPSRRPWQEVLGVAASERDPAVIKTAYRRLVRAEHPDRGGTGQRMPELNQAIEDARAELGFV